jgi:hypothetical protein
MQSRHLDQRAKRSPKFASLVTFASLVHHLPGLIINIIRAATRTRAGRVDGRPYTGTGAEPLAL